MPLVTVLMGVFNGREHLVRAVESVLTQTFGDFEFLIVDDASTDGTAALLRRLATRDARIRVLEHSENLGLGAALHRGVDAARGDLIARIDSDDECQPQRLDKQVEYLRSHPEADIVGSFAEDVAADGRVLRVRRVPTGHDRIAALVWTNPFVHSTVMFRRESILRAGSYDARLRRRQDYDLWFRCARAGLGFANLPEPLVRYRVSEDTYRRSHPRAALDQVRIGLRGCRLVRAPIHAYAGVCLPFAEALMPAWLRIKLVSARSRIDPRTST